ncbi:MAG TPA: hypothetical protein PLV92_00420, partial [Pirellulaceae bacterium]|nr:hypothetical protein [Pirellulaceae bacterium]
PGASETTATIAPNGAGPTGANAIGAGSPGGASSPGGGAGAASPPAKRKLSYKEQQELNGLPAKIEKLEAVIGELHELMAQPDFYRRGGDEIAQRQRELAEGERQLEAALERWAELAD